MKFNSKVSFSTYSHAFFAWDNRYLDNNWFQLITGVICHLKSAKLATCLVHPHTEFWINPAKENRGASNWWSERPSDQAGAVNREVRFHRLPFHVTTGDAVYRNSFSSHHYMIKHFFTHESCYRCPSASLTHGHKPIASRISHHVINTISDFHNK